MAAATEQMLAGVLSASSSIADVLEATLPELRENAGGILALTLYLSDAQRQDLEAQAKRLCDNLSAEVAVYSFLSDWFRKLAPHIESLGDPAVSAELASFKVRVLGD